MTQKKHASRKREPVDDDLSSLRYEIDNLKKSLQRPDTSKDELLLEIESLKDSLHELHAVFKKALDHTKDEEDVVSHVKKMVSRLNAVEKQNETIAHGMVAIADKVDRFVKGGAPAPSPVQAPVQHTMGPPQMPGPRVAPRPAAPPAQMPPMPAPTMDMPPPPPGGSADKKKSFGNIFK